VDDFGSSEKNPERGMFEEKANHRKYNRPLTIRRERYFELLCKGMPATEAARRAGYSGKNPAQSAYQAWRSISERVQNAMLSIKASESMQLDSAHTRLPNEWLRARLNDEGSNRPVIDAGTCPSKGESQ
jgi:hypothetical protein